MGIQTKGDREKFNRLRQSLVRLAGEVRELIESFLSNQPVVKGSVYELKRKCGKPGCKCAQGELHARMVVSASEKGRTSSQVIPHGFLVEVERKVRRYQELRRARAKLVGIHRQMLRVMDEIEGMRREDLSSKGKK